MMWKLFKRTRTKYVYFQTGTSGMDKHRDFIKEIDSNGFKIVNAWVTYHDYSSSHKPAYLHYVITFKK